LKLEQLNLLIDAYQDGQIEKEDAIELAQVIRSGGPQSEWVMSELEIRGLIAHVLDESSPSKFVQSLLERFRAESDGKKFEQDFQERLKSTTKRSQPNSKENILKQAINTVGTATEADRLGGVTQKNHRKLLISLASMVLILLFVFTSLNWFAKEVAILEMHQSGLRLQRDNHEMKLTKGMSLYAGDRLSFLGQGSSTFRLKNNAIVNLLDETSLVFNLKSQALERAEFLTSQSLFLERGKLFIKINKGASPLVVWTPHSILSITEGSLEIISSDLTTMLKLSQCKAKLGTISNKNIKELSGQQTILVDDVGQIEELNTLKSHQIN